MIDYSDTQLYFNPDAPFVFPTRYIPGAAKHIKKEINQLSDKIRKAVTDTVNILISQIHNLEQQKYQQLKPVLRSLDFPVDNIDDNKGFRYVVQLMANLDAQSHFKLLDSNHNVAFVTPSQLMKDMLTVRDVKIDKNTETVIYKTDEQKQAVTNIKNFLNTYRTELGVYAKQMDTFLHDNFDLNANGNQDLAVVNMTPILQGIGLEFVDAIKDQTDNAMQNTFRTIGLAYEKHLDGMAANDVNRINQALDKMFKPDTQFIIKLPAGTDYTEVGINVQDKFSAPFYKGKRKERYYSHFQRSAPYTQNLFFEHFQTLSKEDAQTLGRYWSSVIVNSCTQPDFKGLVDDLCDKFGASYAFPFFITGLLGYLDSAQVDNHDMPAINDMPLVIHSYSGYVLVSEILEKVVKYKSFKKIVTLWVQDDFIDMLNPKFGDNIDAKLAEIAEDIVQKTNRANEYYDNQANGYNPHVRAGLLGAVTKAKKREKVYQSLKEMSTADATITQYNAITDEQIERLVTTITTQNEYLNTLIKPSLVTMKNVFSYYYTRDMIIKPSTGRRSK